MATNYYAIRRAVQKTLIPGVFVVSHDESTYTFEQGARRFHMAPGDCVSDSTLPVNSILITQLGSYKINALIYHTPLATLLSLLNLDIKIPLPVVCSRSSYPQIMNNRYFEHFRTRNGNTLCEPDDVIVFDNQWIIDQFFNIIFPELKDRIDSNDNSMRLPDWIFKLGNNSYVSAKDAPMKEASPLKITNGFSPALIIHGMADDYFRPSVKVEITLSSKLIDIMMLGVSIMELPHIIDTIKLHGDVPCQEIVGYLENFMDMGFSDRLSFSQLPNLLKFLGMNTSRKGINQRSTLQDILDVFKSTEMIDGGTE